MNEEEKNMFENLVSINAFSFILVFLEGIISFLSPCILPLIPLYIGYLSGGAKKENKEGEIVYDKKKTILNTIFFVIGISAAFFILGLFVSALGTFFQKEKEVFTRIASIIIILLGIWQLGIVKFKWMQKEWRITKKINLNKMNPLIAFVLGFTFSFSWTPCVGPMLSSVLLLASSSTNVLLGNLLLLVYVLGFMIPFVILGLLATKVLNFFKAKPKILHSITKIGAIILVIIGIITLIGSFWGNSKEENIPQTEVTDTAKQNTQESNKNSNNENVSKKVAASDFTLLDQYGIQHQLSEYKGKVVFLNFWATWCSPCNIEMPYIEELYHEYGENKGEVVILGVANPKSDKNPYGADKNIEEVTSFLRQNQYTFPVVFDETSLTFQNYHIQAFPTTYMIDKEGNIFGYVEGSLHKEMMKKIIEQTLSGKYNATI